MPRARSLCRLLEVSGAALLAAAALAGPSGSASAGSERQGMSMAEMPGGAIMGRQATGGQAAVDVSALGIAGPQHITVYVLPGASGLGFTGPDKSRHDTIVPSSFVLRKGVPVTITVINLDDMRHSITAPGLGVNIVVQPGGYRQSGAAAPNTTTYTFVPAKAGEFRWFCVFPCDMPGHWAMTASHDGPDRDGFMAGTIRVL